MGGCFLSLGLFVSSLTKNQIVAGMVTFAVFLMFWVINWIATFTGPTTQAVLNYLSITEHLNDFTRGVIDTKHLVYYVFLHRVQPVPDRPRGRQRTLARISRHVATHSQHSRVDRHGARLRRRRHSFSQAGVGSTTPPTRRGRVSRWSCSTRSASGARSSPTSAVARRATARSPRSACSSHWRLSWP